MTKRNWKKKIVVISIVIVCLIITVYVEKKIIKNLNSEIESSLLDLTIELNKVERVRHELNITNMKLQENQTTLNELKSGDAYHLHDPTYEEVIEFLISSDCSTAKEMIKKAKRKGIRCAYVMAYVGGESITNLNTGETISMGGRMHPLVGFDTIDEGMMYYEADTEYQVMPIVGKDYTNCVVGDPYIPMGFDNITDILIIW